MLLDGTLKMRWQEYIPGNWCTPAGIEKSGKDIGGKLQLLYHKAQARHWSH